MNATADKTRQIDLNLDIDPNLGDGLQNGLNALGQVFGGLVDAIKDVVGPETLTCVDNSWTGELPVCLRGNAILA